MPRSRAVVVGVEQAAQAAEARGLDVDHARAGRAAPRCRRSSGCRVPGEALAVRRQHRLGLGRERRVLDPGVGERLDHAPVEHRVGRLVDDRARVVALEVDRVNGARRDQLGDQLLVPRARRVELEAQAGVRIQAPAQRLHASAARPAAARRRSAPAGARAPSAACSVVAGLAQREVERGGLIGPRPVAAARPRAAAARGTARARPGARRSRPA